MTDAERKQVEVYLPELERKFEENKFEENRKRLGLFFLCCDRGSEA
jgi:hypothetical protein